MSSRRRHHHPQTQTYHPFAVVLGVFCVISFLVVKLFRCTSYVQPVASESPVIQAESKFAVATFVVTLLMCVILSFTSLVLLTLLEGDNPDANLVVVAQSLWLFSPMLASCNAFFLPWILGRPRDGEGFHLRMPHRRGNRRKLCLAHVLPSFCSLMAYLLMFIFRVHAVVHWDFLQGTVAPRLGLSPRTWPGVQLFVYLAYAVTVGPVWDVTCPPEDDFGGSTGGTYVGTSWLILAFVEEFGWAGTLFPAAKHAFGSFSRGYLITSTVWVLWHVPFIVGGSTGCCSGFIPQHTGYQPGTEGTPLPWALVGFALDLFPMRYIMCALQDQVRGAIWVCVLFHATHNMMVTSLFSQLLGSKGGDQSVYVYFVGESGVFQIAVYLVCAYLFCRCRSRSVQNPLIDTPSGWSGSPAEGIEASVSLSEIRSGDALSD